MKLWALLAGAAIGAILWAQQRPPDSVVVKTDIPTTITVDVTRVNMLFTVTDKKGRFVTNLAKEDFEVVENRKHQDILEFNAESDLPLRLAILIDTSNSIRDRFKFEQEAAIAFVDGTVRPRQDRALVVS